MRSVRIKAFLGIALLVGALVVATPAFANYVLTYYNINMPAFQVQANTAANTKSTTGSSGVVSTYHVDSGYKMNAQMCSLGGVYCNGGTKVHDLTGNSGANLPNTYSAGCACVMGVTTSSFTPVSVNVTGYWDSH